ncbi:MAG: DUF429 domain-containing protein [Ignavibacteriae bacterium]|nr:DUF429 domain-containing protein [Ignavibacteriota bacterium]
MHIIGVDLAWGDTKSDGVCFVEANRKNAHVKGFAYPHGDDELLQCVQTELKNVKEPFITIDAPIICPNKTGTRPVDRLTHTLFHREHAACHPANSTKCPRPIRLLKKLKPRGFKAGWNINPNTHVVAEVYPHPAMVQMVQIYSKENVQNAKEEK